MSRLCRVFPLACALSLACLLLADVTPALASHYYYGTIHWTRVLTHLPATEYRVMVTVQVGGRWSFPYGASPINQCPSGLVTTGAVGAGSCPPVGTTVGWGTLSFNRPVRINSSLTSTTATPLNAVVESVQAGNDAMYSSYTFSMSYPATSDPITIVFTSTARPSNLRDGNNDRPWRLAATINASPAFGTGSPRATALPVINVTTGVLNQFLFPTTARDGFTNRIRLATIEESLLTTQAPADFDVDPAGVITFQPAADGLYAVQLIVTSYDANQNPRNSVPVDFLLRASASTVTANLQSSAATISAAVGETATATVTSTLSPPGSGWGATITHTPLPSGVTVTQSPSGTGLAPHVATVAYAPTIASPGASQVCFQAQYSSTTATVLSPGTTCIDFQKVALETTLTLSGVPAIVSVGDTVTPSGTLVRVIDGAPVPSRTVNFTLTETGPGAPPPLTAGAPTDASGRASVNFVMARRGPQSIAAQSLVVPGDGVLGATAVPVSFTAYQRTQLVMNAAHGVAGASMPLSAALLALPAGTPVPGETIDFSHGGQTYSATTDASGVATITVNATPGVALATATFNGVASYFADPNGQPLATTATASVTVERASTEMLPLTIVESGVGQSATITTTLTRTSTPAGALAGQPVTFTLVPAEGGAPIVATVTTDVDGRATLSFVAAARGDFTVTATFAGDASLHGAAASESVRFVESTVLGVAALPASGVAGAPIHVRAQLTTPAGSPIPNQAVRFQFTGAAVSTGTAVTDGQGEARLDVVFEAPGTHGITAVYDATPYLRSASADGSVTIVAATTSMAPLTLPATASVGDVLTATTSLARTAAPVAPVGGQPVTFTLSGDAGQQTLNAVTDAMGQVSVSFSLQQRGPYSVSAQFAGTQALLPASAAAVAVTVVQRTSLVLSPAHGVAGDVLPLNAMLVSVPQNTPVPGQTVDVTYDGLSLSAVTDAQGVARVTATAFTTGAVWTAHFSNTAAYFADASGNLVPTTATAPVSVVRASTGLAPLAIVAGGVGQSASVATALTRVSAPSGPMAGQPVVFTLTPAGGGPVETATVSTDANGVASWSFVPAARGDFIAAATFAGDAVHDAAAASGNVRFVEHTSLTTVSASGVAGAIAELRARLTSSAGAPVANEPVRFVLTGTSPSTGTAVTNADGEATLSVTFSLPGTFAFSAEYDGTPYLSASAAQGSAVITPAATTMDPVSVPTTAVVGDTVTMSTVLTRASAPAGPLGGQPVVFTLTGPAGATSLSTTTNDAGAASVSVPLNTRGSYAATASYAGTEALVAFTTAGVTFVVYQPSQLAIAAPASIAAGTASSVAATLTTTAGMPLPGQTVSFSFAGAGAPPTVTAVTNAAGTATLPVTFPAPGTVSVSASFSNAVDYFGDPSGTPVAIVVTADIIVVNTTPVFTPPATIVAEAASPNGATVTFVAEGNDAEEGPLSAVCAPASGSSFPLGATTVNCTVTDSAGAAAAGTFVVDVRDTTPPAIAPHGNETREATSAAGAVVDYVPPVFTDAVSGTGAATCAPASGTTFAPGVHTVTCSATDAAGNTSTSTFTVTVSDYNSSTPGEMRGNGFVRDDNAKYTFEFFAREHASGQERARVSLRIDNDGRRRPRRGNTRDDRFRSTTVTAITFSDDPTITPGRPRRPQIDTVSFAGLGEWNGRAGYRYDVVAQDAGEPGRHRETMRMTIWSPTNQVVASFEGELDGGNIRSLRLRH